MFELCLRVSTRRSKVYRQDEASQTRLARDELFTKACRRQRFSCCITVSVRPKNAILQTTNHFFIFEVSYPPLPTPVGVRFRSKTNGPHARILQTQQGAFFKETRCHRISTHPFATVRYVVSLYPDRLSRFRLCGIDTQRGSANSREVSTIRGFSLVAGVGERVPFPISKT